MGKKEGQKRRRREKTTNRRRRWSETVALFALFFIFCVRCFSPQRETGGGRRAADFAPARFLGWGHHNSRRSRYFLSFVFLFTLRSLFPKFVRIWDIRSEISEAGSLGIKSLTSPSRNSSGGWAPRESRPRRKRNPPSSSDPDTAAGLHHKTRHVKVVSPPTVMEYVPPETCCAAAIRQNDLACVEDSLLQAGLLRNGVQRPTRDVCLECAMARR